MRNHPPRWLLALYGVAIAGAWVMLSTSDYQEARKMECANRSTRSTLVEWDSSTDTCKKEKRNGTTAQNR
jgi:hypothetical protein